MKSFLLVLCSLFAGAVCAGPTVIEDSAVLTRPDTSWQFFGRFGVAIDGDYALVSGERYVPDSTAPGGQRHEGTAFIYRRASATRWTYVGRLGPIAPITNLHPGLAMKDGIAVTITERYRIWRRTGDAFTLEPVAGLTPGVLNGPDIEIDSGRIAVHCAGCTYGMGILSKTGTAWMHENGTVHGIGHAPGTIPVSLDLHGNRLLHGNDGPQFGDYAVQAYRRTAAGRWEPDLSPYAGQGEIRQAPLALSGEHFAYAQDPHWGSMLIVHDGSAINYAGSRFGPADLAMQNDLRSASGMERVGDLIAQRNYRYDTGGFAWHLFRINEDANHTQTQVATLQPREGAFLGSKLDASAGRVIVNNWDGASGNNSVRVFELPATLGDPPTQVHNFEPPTSAAAFQPSAGSSFSVVRSGYSYIYRQSSTAGSPGAFLPTILRNQAIETDVTLRAISGSDRWIGLATRRSDDANYYYATFRTSGVIELKRMQGGVITTLATAPATLVTGRPYKLRLESIGTLHRVYLDRELVVSARDGVFAAGTTGILMNRAAADWDNVTVSSNPFTTIIEDDFGVENDLWFPYSPGEVTDSGTLMMDMRQTRGDHVGGARSEEMVVSAQLNAGIFTDPADWVGLAARYTDYRNHIYVSIHGRGVIALWKRVDGVITQLATRRMTVAPNTWYAVRLETAANSTRVYVDGVQMLESNEDLGPLPPSLSSGGIALIAQRSLSYFFNVVAYRP